MKVLIYADAHFSINSSILLGSSNSLNGRLDHLIRSFEWMYDVAERNNVDAIVDLGDLADSCNLRAEEITAISKALSFNTTIPEYHVLGNHERVSEDGQINSVNFITSFPNHKLFTRITSVDGLGIFIPYGKYEDEDLDAYGEHRIAFTHIDIYGADLGLGWMSKSGMTPAYLKSKFDLVVNGHIHKYGDVYHKQGKRILNLGALSAQNFSAEVTPHIGILDTDTLNIEFIDNPCAIYFCNKTITSLSELTSFIGSLKKDHSYVVQVKVPISILEDARSIIQSSKCIIGSRIRFNYDVGIDSVNATEDPPSLDQLDKVESLEGGFSKLIEFIDSSEDSLPFDKTSILNMIKELNSVN